MFPYFGTSGFFLAIFDLPFLIMCSIRIYTSFLSESPHLIKDTAYAKQRPRHPCLAPGSLPILFFLYSFPIRKCLTHWTYQFVRAVVFDLCIDVHSNLAAFMASQILNCFGIYRRMNEVGDIGMPQLMWSYLKVQTISNLTVMRRLFSKNRSNRKSVLAPWCLMASSFIL